jgi:aspartate aminotransferase-like enzyme
MKQYQLMAPGPTPVPSEVLLAMAKPIIHHRTPEYDALFVEVRAGLKRLFQTSAEVIPLACSGTGAMEAAVVNTLSAGDRVVVVRAGKFGDRWLDLAKAYGLNGITAALRSGKPSTPAASPRALKATPDVKAVLVQHSETSTGVLHDVRAYAAVTKQHDAILVVDAVSSLGIADLPMDAWDIDVVISGSQKGLMLPPGLGFCAFNEKAWRKTKRSTLPKFYFNLTDELKYVAKNGAVHAGGVDRRRTAEALGCSRPKDWPTCSSVTIDSPAPRAGVEALGSSSSPRPRRRR